MDERYAALYVRVSTVEQAEQGFSIEAQKDRLAAYCKSQGWDEFKFYVDDGYTGTNIERPALERMIKHISEGKIHTVVVYRLDRLSRKQKDVLNLLEDVFDKHNTHFKSATEPFDTSTPFGKAMVGVLVVFAQLERDTIVERTTEGRRKRVREGLWFGGRVPFGYDWNKKAQELVINPEQAAIVKEIYALFLRGYSRMHIAEVLQPKTTDRIFSHTVIREILARPIYAGFLPQHDGTLAEGNHEAVIDLDTWTRVQEESRRRAGTKPTNEEKKPLLSGLLECGVCGGPMYIFTMKRSSGGKTYEYDYYSCKNQHVRRKDRDTPKCSLGYKREEKLDSIVIEAIMNYRMHPDLLQKEIDSLQVPNEDDAAVKKKLIEKLNDIDAKLDRWYSAFEEGHLDARQFKSRIEPLEEDKKLLQERLFELEDKEEEFVSQDEAFNALNAMAEVWDDMTTMEKRSALKMIIDQVIVNPDDTVQIKWAI